MRLFSTRQNTLVDIKPISGASGIAIDFLDADIIVDVVETGVALKNNGLVEFEDITKLQTRLLLNKSAHKNKEEVKSFVSNMRGQMKKEEDKERNNYS